MNFMQDLAKCERYIRSDVSRFGKVMTYLRMYQDFGYVCEGELLQLTHQHTDITLCKDQLVVTTWPRTCKDKQQQPDMIKTYEAKNYPLLVGFFEYYTPHLKSIYFSKDSKEE